MRNSILTLLSITVLALACGSGGTGKEAVEAGPDAEISAGERIFRTQCVLCHGPNGKLGFNGAKDLTTSTMTQAEMIARVSEGKGRMQPYKNVLTSAEIEAVVKHVRSLPKAK